MVAPSAMPSDSRRRRPPATLTTRYLGLEGGRAGARERMTPGSGAGGGDAGGAQE